MSSGAVSSSSSGGRTITIPSDHELTGSDVDSPSIPNDPGSMSRENSDRLINPSYAAARASFKERENSLKQQSRSSFTAPSGTDLLRPGSRSSFASSPSSSVRERRLSFTPGVSGGGADASSPLLSAGTSDKDFRDKEIQSLRSSSGRVKGISSKFKGTSRVETMEQYQKRMRNYKTMKIITSFEDRKNLSLHNKERIMHEWKSLFEQEKDQMGEITSDAAVEFLSHYDLTPENLSQEQWTEWMDVIEETVGTKVDRSRYLKEDKIYRGFSSSKDDRDHPNTTTGNIKVRSLSIDHHNENDSSSPIPIDSVVSYESTEDDPSFHKVHHLEPLSVGAPHPPTRAEDLSSHQMSAYWSNSFLSSSKTPLSSTRHINEPFFNDEKKEAEENIATETEKQKIENVTIEQKQSERESIDQVKGQSKEIVEQKNDRLTENKDDRNSIESSKSSIDLPTKKQQQNNVFRSTSPPKYTAPPSTLISEKQDDDNLTTKYQLFEEPKEEKTKKSDITVNPMMMGSTSPNSAVEDPYSGKVSNPDGGTVSETSYASFHSSLLKTGKAPSTSTSEASVLKLQKEKKKGSIFDCCSCLFRR
jgi:hypothetical protein